MNKTIKAFLELGKFKISLLATLSTATGYILAIGKLSMGLFVPTVGIFFLASSSCSLNQIQDREYDGRMNRTKNRPLPSMRINLTAAWIYTFTSFLIGCLILYVGSNLIALGLGLLAMAWYNGGYTYLKRITSLAVIPGSLIGSIPPVLGWAAAGRSVWEPSILSVAFLFFIWQVPHFWLLLLNFNKDYEQARLPTLTSIFSVRQLGRITFIWIAASAVTGILMPLYGNALSVTSVILLITISFWLIGTSVNLLRLRNGNIPVMHVFRNINIYILVIIMILSIEKLLIYGKPGLILLVER